MVQEEILLSLLFSLSSPLSLSLSVVNTSLHLNKTVSKEMAYDESTLFSCHSKKK